MRSNGLVIDGRVSINMMLLLLTWFDSLDDHYGRIDLRLIPIISYCYFGLYLMEHKSVSQSEQMESTVECEGLLDEGHRCGACHEVSDAKVRIIIKYN